MFIKEDNVLPPPAPRPDFFELKNTSNETLEITTAYKRDTPGFRLTGPPPSPRFLEPGRSDFFMGYQPGVWLCISPVENSEVFRQGF
jgi:hypothetical protein